MWDEFFRGIGLMTVFLLAGSYWLKRVDYRKEVESIKAQIRHLQARKAQHPEEVAEINERIEELQRSYPQAPRVL